MDATQKIGSELNVELTEGSDAIIVGESLGRKCKKVVFEEEFDDTKVTEENTPHQICRSSAHENIFPVKGLREEVFKSLLKSQK